MEPEALDKLRREKPREFDALAAETVMRWTVETRTRGGAVWFKLPDGDVWPVGAKHSPSNWHPSEQADADYMVLMLVRESWSHDQQASWGYWLGAMHRLRCDGAAIGKRGCVQLFYEPGDYTHAALLVAMAGGGERKDGGR